MFSITSNGLQYLYVYFMHSWQPYFPIQSKKNRHLYHKLYFMSQKPFKMISIFNLQICIYILRFRLEKMSQKKNHRNIFHTVQTVCTNSKQFQRYSHFNILFITKMHQILIVLSQILPKMCNIWCISVIDSILKWLYL